MAAETVTVVFTDLVGSTELLSAVGEETAEVLRREHFGLLRTAVGAHGGREVKNLGDGLMVVFASAADAVAAGVAIQQAFERRNATAEHPLMVRVGISMGDTDVEDGDHFGVPVVEAARLCAASQSGGEILVTDLVRMVTGRRGGFTFESIGELDLKGLDGLDPACRVAWEPLAEAVEAFEVPPLPSRIGAAVNPGFVGRRVEHGALVATWKSVVTLGEQRVMLLAGEPGIGKTTLSARFASEAHADGAVVLYGRSDEDLGVPYQPWIEALGQLVVHAPQRLLDAHVADRGAHLARLIPDLAGRTGVEAPAGGDADSERFVLFGCVADLLGRVSAERPVLVVMDDLHWVDKASVQLLRHLVTVDRRFPLGVLGTFRDSEVDTAHPVTELLAALHREGCVEKIALGGLTDVDLLALLETVAGHEMDDQGLALRDALVAETAGNPFFVAEILRHLSESGMLYQRGDGRWVADSDLRAVGLPVSIRDVVGRRLAALGPDTERLLAFAAVIGRDFDIGLLSTVARVDEDTVIDVCERAVASSVLQITDTPGGYTFAHALIEHTLYDSLSPTRRVRAHKTIAEALETSADAEGARVGELAYHWGAAVQPSDLTKAIRYAKLAGDRALHQLAPDEAIRWYSQGLELADRLPQQDPRERVEVLIGLGIAQRQTGDPAHRETLLDAARQADQLDHVDLLARAVIANNRGWQSSIAQADAERIGMLDRAVARLDPTALAERARLLATAAVERIPVSPLDERVALAEEAVAAARESGDRAALAFALRMGSFGSVCAATLPRFTILAREACDIYDQLDDPAGACLAHVNAFIGAIHRADADGVERHFAAFQDYASRVPDAALRWNELNQQALVAGMRGDLGAHEQGIEAALAYGLENGQPDAVAIFGMQLLNLRYHQGRFHEMVPLIEQAIDDNPGMSFRPTLTLALACADGHDSVRDLLHAAVGDGFSLTEDLGWATGVGCWAEAAWRTGVPEVAPPLRALLAPYHDQVVTTGATFNCSVAWYLGLLDRLVGDHDGADRWFAESLEVHQRLRSPILVAATRAAWAGLLADRDQGDDYERAREMAHAALEPASAGGWGYIEADARAVLDRLG